jgi:hypothetical protein
MQSSDKPSKISLPFADTGTKRTIPVASQIGIIDGAASYTDGFPPKNFLPISASGVPPAGADFNGILNATTALERWFSAGGNFPYDGAYSALIGGYPKGARVAHTTNGDVWINTVENNVTDPEGGSPAGWIALSSPDGVTFDITAPNFAVGELAPGVSSAFSTSQLIDVHARYNYLSNDTYDFTGNVEPLIGSAAFNDNTTSIGSVAFDHHAGYQFYHHYNSPATSGSIRAFWGLLEILQGSVNEMAYFTAENPTGAGTISSLYGVLIRALTKGSAQNWAIYTQGATKSKFEGKVEFGDRVTVIKDGSDTVGSGPVLGVTNAADTRRWYQQLSAGNGLTTWHYNGTVWTTPFALSAADMATFTGTVTAGAFSTAGDITLTGVNQAFRKVAAEGVTLLGVYGSVDGITIQAASGTGFNGAASCMFISKNTGTNRSINAAGTINASGADVAEYEYNNNLVVQKGDVIGFKADGTLTNVFAEAKRFGIKSTNPSLCNGDTWGSEEKVGKRPAEPVRVMPVVAYDGEQEPVTVTPGDTDAAWAAKVSSYTTQLAAFDARMEIARKGVDRIAYCGKVPVNVTGAQAGGYIVAAQGTGGVIVGQYVGDPTFAQYKLAVGRVNKILQDGTCEVAVIVH